MSSVIDSDSSPACHADASSRVRDASREAERQQDGGLEGKDAVASATGGKMEFMFAPELCSS